jgi:hypothetical protein
VQCRWHEAGDIRSKTIERKNPSGGSELRRPDDVELQDVRCRRARIQPLDVELMALIGGVRRDAQLHPHVRMPLREPIQLPTNDCGFRPERAAGERQHRSRVRGATRDDRDGRDDQDGTDAPGLVAADVHGVHALIKQELAGTCWELANADL